MSFTAELDNPSPEITTLVSFRPRWRIRNWVNANVVGQNVFSAPWSRAPFVALYDMSLDPLAAAASLADLEATKGTFFFDEVAGTLWANFLDQPPAPVIPGPNQRVVVAEWDMFFATQPCNWYRNPRNPGSEDQVWEGGVIKPPIPAQGNPDLIFGFAPTRVSDLQIAVGFKSEVLELLHDWSILGARMKIWNCVGGRLDAQNISEVYVGACGSYAFSGGVLSIELADPLALISQRIPEKYFFVTDFPALAPASAFAPIRRVYGCVQGFVPVNISYAQIPSTTDNRLWVVSQDQTNQAQLTAVIDHLAPETDNSHSKVNDARGFRGGDSIVVEQLGVPTYDISVISVDYVNNVIEHSFIAGRAVGSGDEIRRGFIGAISLVDEDANFYRLSYERDWTEENLPLDTKGFRLADNFEANLPGAPAAFDPGLHKFSCTVYGSTETPKRLDGITDLCPVSPNGGALANPVGLLWKILRGEIRGLGDFLVFDEAAWVAVATAVTRTVGFAIPESSTGDFGNWKTVLQKVMTSEFLRLQVEISQGEARLSITRDEPMGAVEAETGQHELTAPAYTWGYDDVYDRVIVAYGPEELSAGGRSPTTAIENARAAFLHRVAQDYEVETYHYENEHAGEFALRAAAILGERRGNLIGVLPPSYLQRRIGDTLRYASNFLTGFAADAQINSRSYRLARHSKSAAGVSVTLDDQKGIEDFGGTW